MVKPEQIKAARALLRLEQDGLARKAGVSVSTIRRLEADSGDGTVADQTASKVLHVFEEAGVEFIHDGVMIRQGGDSGALYERLRALVVKSAAQQAALGGFTEDDLYGPDGLPS